MIESGHDIMYFNTDLGPKLAKEALSIVIAYNGSHHFTPTRLCTEEQLNTYRVNEVTALCEATLDRVSLINVETFSEEQQDLLLKLVSSMEGAAKGLPAFGAEGWPGCKENCKGPPFH